MLKHRGCSREDEQELSRERVIVKFRSYFYLPSFCLIFSFFLSFTCVLFSFFCVRVSSSRPALVSDEKTRESSANIFRDDCERSFQPPSRLIFYQDSFPVLVDSSDRFQKIRFNSFANRAILKDKPRR